MLRSPTSDVYSHGLMAKSAVSVANVTPTSLNVNNGRFSSTNLTIKAYNIVLHRVFINYL